MESNKSNVDCEINISQATKAEDCVFKIHYEFDVTCEHLKELDSKIKQHLHNTANSAHDIPLYQQIFGDTKDLGEDEFVFMKERSGVRNRLVIADSPE
jgi:hypothetical protein